MENTFATVSVGIALLAAFLIFISALRYAVRDGFTRTRLVMTSFFLFIVCTLTVAFFDYALQSLVYTIPAAILGALLGHFLGVRTEQKKLMAQGIHFYREHFAHVHVADLKDLTWWSVVNFYSVMGALLLINLVGISTVFFSDAKPWAMATCIVGAFLLGSIAPYLVHLWSLTEKNNG